MKIVPNGYPLLLATYVCLSEGFTLWGCTPWAMLKVHRRIKVPLAWSAFVDPLEIMVVYCLYYRHFLDKSTAIARFQLRLGHLSSRRSLRQLRKRTIFSSWNTGSGEMTTQFPLNICFSQLRHCCPIIAITKTRSYVRRRPLIGGLRLKECKLFWGLPLTRC